MTHILRPKVQSQDGVELGGGNLGVGHCECNKGISQDVPVQQKWKREQWLLCLIVGKEGDKIASGGEYFAVIDKL